MEVNQELNQEMILLRDLLFVMFKSSRNGGGDRGSASYRMRASAP
jgi:hypothetical protein